MYSNIKWTIWNENFFKLSDIYVYLVNEFEAHLNLRIKFNYKIIEIVMGIG